MEPNKFQAKTFNNFISQEETQKLLNFCKKTDLWREIPNSFWDKRTINYNNLDGDIKQIIEKAIINLQKILYENYELTQPPYPDTLDVVRWYEGMSQNPHCDDMSDNTESKINFGHRYFGCVIYLNDDYSGGKTYYPEHNFEIKPESGKLAIHLGDCNHRHGVTPIVGNTRYTIASFWTFDKNKAIKNINYKF